MGELPSLDDLAQSSELVIRTRLDADALVLSLYGELDLDSILGLERELEKAVANGSDRVVIDLSGLDFIDSSGLAALLRAHERAQKSHGRLSLVRGQPVVHRVFELTRTDELLHFED